MSARGKSMSGLATRPPDDPRQGTQADTNSLSALPLTWIRRGLGVGSHGDHQGEDARLILRLDVLGIEIVSEEHLSDEGPILALRDDRLDLIGVRRRYARP